MPVLVRPLDRAPLLRVRPTPALRAVPVPALRAVPVPALRTVPSEDVRVEESLGTDEPWTTIVWNDPVNLMSYVTYVFRSYFGYPQHQAEKLMRQVHEEGRAVVSHGTREQMETDVQAMHGFGLWATVQAAGR